MKISIYARGKLAFNPYTEKNVGVGSMETTIVNVAQKLRDLEHEVTVYTNCNFPDIYDGVKYYQSYDYVPSEEDVLIGFSALPKQHNAKQVFLWSTKVEVQVVEQYKDEIEKLIVSSEWHRDRYASELPSDLIEKMTVIKPGVTKDFYESEFPKWDKSITYAGAPQKGGMRALIEYAKRLKPKMAKAMIHAYGGGMLWGWKDEPFRSLYDDMIRSKILYHGQKGKRRLVKQFGYSEIFLYPVHRDYQEAFGLTVLEAMAAKCVPIVSDNGNLKFLVKDAGFVIPGNIDDYKWHIDAVEATFKLFDNPQLMEEMGNKAREYAKEYTWDKTIEEFLKLVH